MLVEYWKEKTYSLSYIRQRAQAGTSFNEHPCTGLNHIETLNALRQFGITWYNTAFGSDAFFVANKVSTYGPVLVGVAGHTYPNWKTRCGYPKAEVGGRTQCDFYGAHAILATKYQRHLTASPHYDFLTRDPNHNSPSRPEEPAFDRITRGQLDKSMKDLPRYTRFTTTYCLYPTRSKIIALPKPPIIAGKARVVGTYWEYDISGNKEDGYSVSRKQAHTEGGFSASHGTIIPLVWEGRKREFAEILDGAYEGIFVDLLDYPNVRKI
jgi:hypothetical protein